jgi:very-short-patch-repair endonuclease
LIDANQTAQTTLSGGNYKRLTQLGYRGIYKSKTDVRICDLSPSSNVKIRVTCDYCGNEFLKSYKSYLEGRSKIEKDACKKCCHLKQQEILFAEYGVTSPFRIPYVINKIKETNKTLYGCENVFSSEEIKNKIKDTNMEKYGAPCVMQTEYYTDKKNKTMLERYGTLNISQVDDIKERKKRTFMERYGYESPLQNEAVKSKIRETNRAKYGVDYYVQTEEFKQKYRESCQKKYGVEHPNKNKEHMSNKINTFTKNDKYPTSKQQREIFNKIKLLYDEVSLNHPVHTCVCDVAMFVDNIKIDIEYDGWYWHQDYQRDRRRDEYLKSQGWKILRIKSGHKMPTTEQLKDTISKLLYTERTYSEIILDDWRGVPSEQLPDCSDA